MTLVTSVASEFYPVTPHAVTENWRAAAGLKDRSAAREHFMDLRGLPGE